MHNDREESMNDDRNVWMNLGDAMLGQPLVNTFNGFSCGGHQCIHFIVRLFTNTTHALKPSENSAFIVWEIRESKGSETGSEEIPSVCHSRGCVGQTPISNTFH